MCSKDNRSLSITLWDDEGALAASDGAASRIRSETTAAQKMYVLGVEAFEVLTGDLKP